MTDMNEYKNMVRLLQVFYNKYGFLLLNQLKVLYIICPVLYESYEKLDREKFDSIYGKELSAHEIYIHSCSKENLIRGFFLEKDKDNTIVNLMLTVKDINNYNVLDLFHPSTWSQLIINYLNHIFSNIIDVIPIIAEYILKNWYEELMKFLKAQKYKYLLPLPYIVKPDNLKNFEYPFSACKKLCKKRKYLWDIKSVGYLFYKYKQLEDILDIKKISKIFYYQEGCNDKRAWIIIFQRIDYIFVYFDVFCYIINSDCRGYGELLYSDDWNTFWNHLDNEKKSLIII